MILDKATIKKDSIASTLLTNQTLNLFGIGSALIGLQVRACSTKACKLGLLIEPVSVMAAVIAGPPATDH